MKENTNTSITAETISEIIIENIKSLDSLFVFPSDASKKSWIDWTINNPKESKVYAFNLDEFVTWDEFKSSFLRTKDENLECIPSAARKIFVENIIAKKDPRMKAIIPKENAFVLTDWLSDILPSLKLWKKQFDKYYATSEEKPDDEDKSYDALYESYTEFLEENNFYEPSYLDIDFKEIEKKPIFIFYPEIIEDFSEYEKTLKDHGFSEPSSSKSICVFYPKTLEDVSNVKKTLKNNENAGEKEGEDLEKKPDCIYFSDTRKELRYLALRLRKLQRDGVDLRTVAINVPDLENLRPYLERELDLYSVPFIIHARNPYTKNCGGAIFLKIRDCFSSNFSYDSIRSLLLDRSIPWKEFEKNEQLIRKGQEMRCICNYEDKKKDVWEASFEELLKKEDIDDAEKQKKLEDHYRNLYRLYRNLKEIVHDFCNAKSFQKVMDTWNKFKSEFIDEKKFSEDQYELTDKIINQIITELASLIVVEKKYSLKSRSPFDFFISEIEKKTYSPNKNGYGVNIFPYRLAACSAFDYQFVINASQKNLSVSFKRLDFIGDPKKRENLELDEKDMSSVFVNLYGYDQKKGKKKDKEKVFFSAAKESLDGFSIVHTALNGIDFDKKSDDEEQEKKRQEKKDDLDKIDFISEAKKRFYKGEDGKGIEISKLQKEAFENWNSLSSKNEPSHISETLKEAVKTHMTKKEENPLNDKYKITPTEMNSFFDCPRKFLFSKVLKLKEDSLDVSLTKSYEIGTFIHKIIELVFSEFAKKDKKYKGNLPIIEDVVDEDIKDLVENCFYVALGKSNTHNKDKSADNAPKKNKDKPVFKRSPLAQNVIENQKDLICDIVCDFLKEFCKKPDDDDKKCFGGFKIIGLELPFESKVPSKSDSKKIDFDFYGKIDCVLAPPCNECEKNSEHNEWEGCNKYIIVDFKTGKAPTISDSILKEENGVSVIKDFQLGCYVKLLEQGEVRDSEALFYNEDKGKKVSNALFYKVKKSDTDGNPTVQVISEEKDRDAFDSTLTELEKYAEYFCDKCEKNDFEPLAFKSNSKDDDRKKYRKKYGINVYKDCIKCNFNSICRTSFNISKNELH